jgi:hypothetical protein
MINSPAAFASRPDAEPERLTPLPPHRAFLVQLRADADPALCMMGRIEHVKSGRAAHFDSLDELLAFVHRMLTP